MARHPQLLWSVAFAPEGWHVAACHGAVGQSPSVRRGWEELVSWKKMGWWIELVGRLFRLCLFLC